MADSIGEKRLLVHSPKTEHNNGGHCRFVPLFPELRALLLDAFSQAEEGAEYVVTRCRNSKTNLRTQMERIIKRAGVKPWPKLFHNLRSTRQTELTEKFPSSCLRVAIQHPALHRTTTSTSRMHTSVSRDSAPRCRNRRRDPAQSTRKPINDQNPAVQT